MLAAVTGASGHLGNALVRALLAQGHEVRAVDIVPSVGFEGLDIEWRAGNVLDAEQIRDAIDGVHVVFHLAARISVTGDPDGVVRRINVDGVRNTARAALDVGAGRFVHCSSVHAFDLERARHHVARFAHLLEQPFESAVVPKPFPQRLA